LSEQNRSSRLSRNRLWQKPLMRRLVAVIVVAAAMLPACKKEPGQAERPTTVSDAPPALTDPQQIRMTTKAVKHLKSDLRSFQLTLYPGPKVPSPRPTLLIAVTPDPHKSPETVFVHVSEDVATKIIDAAASRGILFRGTISGFKRSTRGEPEYTIAVQGPQTGSIYSYWEDLDATTDLASQFQCLRDLIPPGEERRSMDRFMKDLKAATTKAAANLAPEKQQARTPEQLIRYLDETIDCDMSGRGREPLYAIIPNSPDAYEREIRKRVIMPEESDAGLDRPAQARVAHAMSLIHVLGQEKGTRLALELYSEAADREEDARRRLTGAREAYDQERSADRLKELRTRGAAVLLLEGRRICALQQLSELRSPDLIPQGVASFAHESFDLKIWLVQYFEEVKATDALIVALRDPDCEAGSLRQRVLAALRRMTLTDAQRKEVESLNPPRAQ
jgi:hypothetical protein